MAVEAMLAMKTRDTPEIRSTQTRIRFVEMVPN